MDIEEIKRCKIKIFPITSPFFPAMMVDDEDGLYVLYSDFLSIIEKMKRETEILNDTWADRIAFLKRELKLSDVRGDAAEAEVSRLNTLLSEARECYESWKDGCWWEQQDGIQFHKAAFVFDMWQIIKKIGEEK